MNEEQTENRSVEDIADLVANTHFPAQLLLMSEYRPDICRGIAFHNEYRFYDYREEVMKERKFEAASITLEELWQTLEQESLASPLLAFNVEALLAVKPENDRKSWLQKFMRNDWKNKVILPLVLFHEDAPKDLTEQIIDCRDDFFEPQSFLSRLAM